MGGPQIISANEKSVNLRSYQIIKFAICGLTIKIADLHVHLCIGIFQIILYKGTFKAHPSSELCSIYCSYSTAIHTQKHGSIVQYKTVSWSKHAADDLMSCAQLS